MNTVEAGGEISYDQFKAHSGNLPGACHQTIVNRQQRAVVPKNVSGPLGLLGLVWVLRPGDTMSLGNLRGFIGEEQGKTVRTKIQSSGKEPCLEVIQVLKKAEQGLGYLEMENRKVQIWGKCRKEQKKRRIRHKMRFPRRTWMPKAALFFFFCLRKTFLIQIWGW